MKDTRRLHGMALGPSRLWQVAALRQRIREGCEFVWHGRRPEATRWVAQSSGVSGAAVQARLFGLRSALALVLLAGLIGPARDAAAQSADDIDALNRRVLELYGAGKYAEAIPLARRYADAMKIRRGSDHPDYATALNNLSQLLVETNRLADAEPPMRQALAIDEKSFGPEHPNVARDVGNLALLLKDSNRLTEAEPLLRRALAIDEKTRGLSIPRSPCASAPSLACWRPPTGSSKPSRSIAARSPSMRGALVPSIPTLPET
jgi:tetratricopeptide (TPR) repeat protein